MVITCQPHGFETVYIIIAICSGTIFLIFVSLVLVHHFKWSLRWHFYMLQRRLRHLYQREMPGYHNLVEINEHYHAFIAHNHDHDRSWVIERVLPKAEKDWGLHMCIGYRDFVPGIAITENVVNAIDRSRKVILVVTTAFAESEWCEFEMQMALTSKGMKHIIICYYQEVPYEDMSPTLRSLIRHINYIPWSEENDGEHLFWQRLQDALLKRDDDE